MTRPPYRLTVASKTTSEHAAEGNQDAATTVQVRFSASRQHDTLLICFHSADVDHFPAHEQFVVGKTYRLVEDS
jgi:hypothetical protein